MSKNIAGGGWTFMQDHVNAYAYWDGAFNSDECKQIIELGKALPQQRGTTFNQDTEYRASNVAWIYPSDESNWVFARIAQIVNNLNDNFFGFDLFGMVEGLQFTVYEGVEEGKYGKHTDVMFQGTVRKLSITVQLSDENSYEGGDLILHTGKDGYTNSKGQGRLLAFPSYTLHEVKPVTKGTRYSLVAWVTGKPFK
jgi:PKHD-type hydroxylase